MKLCCLADAVSERSIAKPGRNTRRLAAAHDGPHRRKDAPIEQIDQKGLPMSSPYRGSRLGTRFGPYEMRSLIGVGGMGEVYRAYDTLRDRMVAVKVLRADLAADPEFQERFRRESRVAARLQEPHVIPVHDFGDIDGALYIDMRLVEGINLNDAIRAGGGLEPARAVSIIAQVASALDAAHADGLVHRDIKPENVLLTPDDFAYLVDFGIAHTGGDPGVTMTGLVIGSCAYMAPERFGGGPVGPQADVYSLACLLYESVTGRPPFENGDVRQMMSSHMFAQPPRPSITRRGISPSFDAVIARGMAKQPADRFASAGELARAAGAAASAAAPVPPATGPGQLAQTRQFTAVYPNPAATGYTPYPPAPPQQRPQEPPQAPQRRPRFSPAQVGLVAVTVVLFGVASVLAAILITGNWDTSPGRLTPAAQPPMSAATETTTGTTASTTATTTTETTTTPSPTTTATTTTSPTTTTTSASSTSPTARAGMTGADAQGFVGRSARCDSGDAPAAMVRTAQSLAVVCESGPNRYYYRGERLSDGASIELGNAVRSGGGFDVVNSNDGTRYEVRPDRLTILSDGHVDSSEPALQYASE